MQENRLSPFYSELLASLKQDIDPSISLSEIIDNYQHLFQAKNQLHIEKLLRGAFSPKSFVDLGLARMYPRIYRGLPRLYHRDAPSRSYIKENFTHLPSLKRGAASRALFSLYGKFPAKGKVTIFTWVIGDGLGDYVASLEVFQMLCSRLPKVEFQMVALVQDNFLSQVIAMEKSLIIPYKKECAMTPEVLSLLYSSDLILQIPTFYPHTLELCNTLQTMGPAPPKMELVGEYGFVESKWFHPKSGYYSMGLHFLEKGILIRQPISAEWSDVKNQQLLKWRCVENHFYLAYLTTPIGGAIYLHSLLKSLEDDKKGIDICVPDLRWFIQLIDIQNKAGRPLLQWEVGVASIEVYFQDQCHTVSTASEGKKIRLLCPGLISQTDFRSLLALSGNWIAVRGDQSFSEAISQGKAFFFDCREHARYFIKDLAAIAENRISSYPTTLTCIRGIAQGFLYNIPSPEGEWVDETFFQPLEEWSSIALHIGLSLQDPATSLGYTQLIQILRTEFSANPFLCHLVQRALCHRQNPLIEQLETTELGLFTSGAQTFSQLIESHRANLSTKIFS